MDIMRYGPDVEVVSPAGLRDKIATQMKAALRTYGEI